MKASAVRVEDLMSTAVISLRAKDNVERAKLEMETAEIRHLPVVDDRNHVVGIVSSKDLQRAMARVDRKGLHASDIMTTRVVIVRPSTPAYQAASMLLEHKISSLPVVNDEEELIGVITSTDFLIIAHDALRGLPIGGR